MLFSLQKASLPVSVMNSFNWAAQQIGRTEGNDIQVISNVCVDAEQYVALHLFYTSAMYFTLYFAKKSLLWWKWI